MDTDNYCFYFSLFSLLQTLHVCGKMVCGAPSAKKIPMSFVPATLFAEPPPRSGRAALRRRPGITATLPNGKVIGSSWIVSYSIIYLLLKYACHINVVVCTSVNLIKYLYKYNFKGGYRAMV
jgi:hypothetical protein